MALKRRGTFFPGHRGGRGKRGALDFVESLLASQPEDEVRKKLKQKFSKSRVSQLLKAARRPAVAAKGAARKKAATKTEQLCALVAKASDEPATKTTKKPKPKFSKSRASHLLKAARPPADIAQGAAHKKTATETKQLCVGVAKALLRAELPTDVIQLLSACTVASLGEPQEERHTWQAKMVQWIAATLADVAATLAQRASMTQSTLDKASAEYATEAASLGGAEERFVKLEEAVLEAETKRVEAVAAHSRAEEALKMAAAAAEAGETEILELESSIPALRTEILAVLGGPCHSWRTTELTSEIADDVAAVLERHDFERGLVQAVPRMLVKPPFRRTDFTAMVMQQFEVAVEQRLSELDDQLPSTISAQKEKEAALAAAAESLTSATDELKVVLATGQDAQAGVKQGKMVVEEAKKALKPFSLAVSKAQSAATTTSAASSAFQYGPLAIFRQLELQSATTRAEIEDQPAQRLKLRAILRPLKAQSVTTPAEIEETPAQRLKLRAIFPQLKAQSVTTPAENEYQPMEDHAEVEAQVENVARESACPEQTDQPMEDDAEAEAEAQIESVAEHVIQETQTKLHPEQPGAFTVKAERLEAGAAERAACAD